MSGILSMSFLFLYGFLQASVLGPLYFSIFSGSVI